MEDNDCIVDDRDANVTKQVGIFRIHGFNFNL